MPSESPWPVVAAPRWSRSFFVFLPVTCSLDGGLRRVAARRPRCLALRRAAGRMSESAQRGLTASRCRVAGARRSLPNGWWGMRSSRDRGGAVRRDGRHLFYLRFRSPQWPPGGHRAAERRAAVALTAVLVATPADRLAAAPRGAGARGAAWRARLIASRSRCSAATSRSRSRVLRDDLGEFSPSDNAYGSIYFTLLGAHHAHVVFGILLDLWLLMRLGGGLTHYRAVAAPGRRLYWYFVIAAGDRHRAYRCPAERCVPDGRSSLDRRPRPAARWTVQLSRAT